MNTEASDCVYKKITLFIEPEPPLSPGAPKRFRIMLREKMKHPTMGYGMIFTEEVVDASPEEYLAAIIAKHLRKFSEALKEARS